MVAFGAVSCAVWRVCDATKITKKCFGLQHKAVALAPAFLSRFLLKHLFLFTACVQPIAVISRKHEDLITDSPHVLMHVAVFLSSQLVVSMQSFFLQTAVDRYTLTPPVCARLCNIP